MEIPEKLLRFKYHFLIALILGAALSTLILVAPRFLTILAYFWPLLLSTALFLAAVLVFGKTSSPAVAVDKAGEGLLDYVAGQPDHHHHPHHPHHEPVAEGFKPHEQNDEHAVESSKSE